MISSKGIDETNSSIPGNTAKLSSAYLSLIYTHSLPLGTSCLTGSWRKLFQVFKSRGKLSRPNYRPVLLTCISQRSWNASFLLWYHPLSWRRPFYPLVTPLFQKRIFMRNSLSYLRSWFARLSWSLLPNRRDCSDFSKGFYEVLRASLIVNVSQLNRDPRRSHEFTTCLLYVSNMLISGIVFHSSPLFPLMCNKDVHRPLLILVYIYNTPDVVSSHIHILADGCVVYRSTLNRSDRLYLQHSLMQIRYDVHAGKRP